MRRPSDPRRAGDSDALPGGIPGVSVRLKLELENCEERLRSRRGNVGEQAMAVRKNPGRDGCKTLSHMRQSFAKRPVERAFMDSEFRAEGAKGWRRLEGGWLSAADF